MRAKAKVTDSILGRWIGWKVVIYNINNDEAVKMESYLDDKNNNNWKKVTELIDKGGWYADTSDKVFYSANCDRPKDYIITNSGPIVTFRSDNMMWDFIDYRFKCKRDTTSIIILKIVFFYKTA